MNVLAICPGFIPSVLLCGDCQLKFLQDENKLKYKFLTPREVTEEDLLWLDVLYVIRGDSPYILSLATWCKKHNKIVIYVLDDNLLEIPNNLDSSAYYLKRSTKRSINKLINLANGFVSPSEKLIKKYSTTKHHTLQIIEPSINPILNKETNNVIKIGFAGSIDHANDIDNMLKDVFIELKNKYGNSISIELFGPKTSSSHDLNLVYYPFLDSYSSYQDKMRELNWDIGLAPLEDTIFNQYKHYNKLVEYETYGIAGVYSDVYPYKYAVKNLENGILTKNDKESWYDSISLLIDNALLRKDISQNCLNEANTKYSLQLSSTELFDFLEGFKYKKKDCSKKILQLKMKYWKFKYFFQKGQLIKLPLKFIKKVINKIYNLIYRSLRLVKHFIKRIFK